MRQNQTFVQRFIRNWIPPVLQKNAMGEEFLGVPLFNRSRVPGMIDSLENIEAIDNYKGYMFAAINKRSKKVAKLAVNNLVTVKNQNGKDDPDVDTPHPYLTLIDQSPTFSNFWFWRALSTFIDLKGSAYLFLLRSYNDNVGYGQIQEIKVLNPFNIRRVINKSTQQVEGYEEWRGNQYRKLPVQQVMDIKELDPFNTNNGYAVTNATEDSVRLKKRSFDRTLKAVKTNTSNKRGMLSTDLELTPEQMENWKASVKAEDGDLLFSSGGAQKFTDMSIDINKLALDTINNMSREEMFAVMGMSKTTMGIEESGTTRDTSKIHQEQLLEDVTETTLQLIIDAFNQDYRNNYKTSYEKDLLEIRIDSPLKRDRDAEKADADIVLSKSQAAKTLVQAGYDPTEALIQVGLDDMAYVGIPAGMSQSDSGNSSSSNNTYVHNHGVELKLNGFDSAIRSLAMAKQTTLKTDMQTIQSRILSAVIAKTNKNDTTQEDQDKLIDKSDADKYRKEIEAVLAAFYISLMPLFAGTVQKERLKQFGLASTFKMDGEANRNVAAAAKLASESHMATTLGEMQQVVNDAVKAGKSRVEIINDLKTKYANTLSKATADRLARTETNRTVAQSQYEADRQFVKQNDLQERAFKRWITRSANPCQYCKQLEADTAQNPIPLDQNFVDKGEGVTASETSDGETTSRTYVAGYEDVGSGTLHPNCSCIYELIIVEG